ncbi:uncharacterized protein EI90DRAFT_916599 [Cantharellus anzutake]|uniref:uncharacterized protein n=1 Tax=Cantharellus anzutake TaxID=1750568 RepID=UPI001908B496|nr:uncharacterized protein EI90DRAFT_916599 [Cantharellus anzutake]KAF8332047.1 hypothetical protein EI90DRAFT_916599 [Cantharellus anzutake]
MVMIHQDRRRGVRGYHRHGSISSAYGDDYYDDSYLSDDDERYSHYGGRRRLSTGSTGALIPSGFGAGYGSYPQLTYAGQQVGYPTAGYPATSAYGYQPATVGGGLMVPHARSRASSFSYAGSPGYMY